MENGSSKDRPVTPDFEAEFKGFTGKETADILKLKFEYDQGNALLGKGGFGTVYKLKYKPNGQTYAVKCIPFVEDSNISITDIQTEIKLLNVYRHPNIVSYYGKKVLKSTDIKGCFATRSNVWIVMEYCSAGCVGDILYKNQKSVPKKYLADDEIAFILAGVAEGLSYLHGKNAPERKSILHRDLKADNILISNDGTVKICDFGLTKVLASETDMAFSHVGTAYHMAPEIFHWQGHSFEADIFSLGVTAIELAENTAPRRKLKIVGNKEEYLEIYESTNSESPSLRDPKSRSADLVKLVESCCKVDRHERPSTEALLTDFPFITRGKTVSKDILLKYVPKKDQKVSPPPSPRFTNADIVEAIEQKRRSNKSKRDRALNPLDLSKSKIYSGFVKKNETGYEFKGTNNENKAKEIHLLHGTRENNGIIFEGTQKQLFALFTTDEGAYPRAAVLAIDKSESVKSVNEASSSQ